MKTPHADAKTETASESLFNNDLFKNLPSMPSVDVQALLASQKANIEAIVEANRVAFEGLKTVAARQQEILRGALEEIQAAAHDLKSPEKIASFTAEMAKKSFDQAREIGELVVKANRDVLDVVNKRAQASMAELKASVKVAKA